MKLKKILMVDDEVDLIETVRFPLEMEGYQVLVSYNGSTYGHFSMLRP